jgi:hypothetical protein
LLEVVPMADRRVSTVSFTETLEANVVTDLPTTLGATDLLSKDIATACIREH